MTGSRRLVLVVMCAGYFLVLLDVTVVNVALPRIGAGLGAAVTGLQWVVDGYAVAPAALIAAPQAYRTRGRTAGLPNLQPRRATMAA